MVSDVFKVEKNINPEKSNRNVTTCDETKSDWMLFTKCSLLVLVNHRHQ